MIDLRGRPLRGPHGTLTIVADALVAAVLAPCCAACATPLARPTRGPVCDTCWAAVPRLLPPCCRGCGDALVSWREPEVGPALCSTCRQRAPLTDMSAAAGRYEGSLRLIIHAFKYDGRRSLGPRLGQMLKHAGREVLDGADCAVPVPLHPWRRFTRGFNQAADLAAHLGRPVVPALWRTRATLPQSGLTAAGRRRNVRGAFRISPLLSGRARALLFDRVVVLVDDVRTTGATIESCARMLRNAGAREVRALTLALAQPVRSVPRNVT